MNIYKCDKCDKSFGTKQARGAHQISHKDGQRYSVKRKQKNSSFNHPETYACIFCGKESVWNHRKTNQFCSLKCSSESRRIMEYNEKNHPRAYRYKVRKNRQTPPDADMEKIKEIYENCPTGYEVDHIIPISRGGLHHQDNLQYLTISENRSKGNKLPDEM